MSKELVISSNRHETKVAILEDDQLVEIYFQRAHEYSLAGSIHKGRVTRVLPGMQSAFVDLGLERDTFLYVSDFFEENEEYDRIPIGKEDRPARAPERAQRGPLQEARSQEGRSQEGRPPEALESRTAEPPFEPGAAGPGPDDAATEMIAAAAGAAEEPAALPETEELPPDAAEFHAGANVSAAAPSAGSDRGEEGDGRDRRGRRSRRRRNRGRGFPDSKYAAEVKPGAEKVEAAPAAVYLEPAVSRSEPAVSRSEPAFNRSEPAFNRSEPAFNRSEPAVSRSEQEFSVLPGESLAKYTRPHAAEEDEPAIQPLDEEEREELLAARLEEQPHREPVGGEETAGEEEAGEEEVGEEAGGDLTAAPAAEPEFEPEAAHEADPEAPPAGAPTEMAELPAGQPATANVREQSGRYMHRLPRRMRRKMRSGGSEERRGDDRRGEDRRGDAPPLANPPEAAAAAPKTEPEKIAARPEKNSSAQLITELLKEGQEIIVQIAKEPLGQKGARITSHIALPGRYVVYMPTLDHMGVSRKIASDEERLRLKRILQAHRAGVAGGLIVRTAGEGRTEEEIAADISFLSNLWLDMRQKAEKRPAPVLLHHDLDIVQRTLRDQLTENFKAIWADNEDVYESILRFVQRFQPALVGKVKLYTRPAPIFDAFNITAELEKALRPKVWLKSGGYIVINQTEALVAVDVNTGKYVGKSNRLEDTIVKTNTEAVKEIVRQIRLRDLGGIIVVDFIDMDERKNRQKVMQALEDAMRSDRAPNKILQFNDFGLVAITRKRVKQSLERTLCAPCPYCEGAGYVKSPQTIVGEILQEAHKLVAAVQDQKDVILRVHPDVARIMKSNHNKYLEELEETLRRPVLVKGDPGIHQDKFDLA